MLTELEPKLLWRHFAQICAIPHPSYHEEALIRALEQFAEHQGLAHQRDRGGNLIIRKPASPGCEQAPGVILQSHVDMVPQKADDSTHNFLTDPIIPRIEDGWVHATDTTLGADNGIGVAAILAVLEDQKLIHGPIEALFTINEESGMDGARELEPGVLQGSLLLNLDSEDEHELYVGCAGGIDLTATLEMERDDSHSQLGYQLVVRGLHGGHSGLDIHLGRGNANRLLATLLLELQQQCKLQLFEFNGGTLRNAIARRAEAVIGISQQDQPLLLESIENIRRQWQQLHQQLEPQLQIGLLQQPLTLAPLSRRSAQQLLDAVLHCPHGVEAMHAELDNVVETSNNLARVNLNQTTLELQCLVRSASEQQRDRLCRKIGDSLSAYQPRIELDGAYPGWTPDLEAPLLAQIQEAHRQLFNKEAEIRVIHAGLECGLLGKVYPNWQMISFGPNISFPHSPSEKVEIASVARFWDFLGACLKRLAQLPAPN